jgi:predicted nucleic-acid-binding protein
VVQILEVLRSYKPIYIDKVATIEEVRILRKNKQARQVVESLFELGRPLNNAGS